MKRFEILSNIIWYQNYSKSLDATILYIGDLSERFPGFYRRSAIALTTPFSFVLLRRGVNFQLSALCLQ